MLTGWFPRSLDDKGRVSIPKRLRDAMGGTDQELVLYLAPGTDGSLTLYTEQGFSKLAELLGGGSPTGEHVRAFSRLFYAQAQRVDLDRQGRLRIPPELLELAALEDQKEAILLGVRDHLELWNRQRWEAYLAQKQSQYDEIAERAFGSPSESGASEPASRPAAPRPR